MAGRQSSATEKALALMAKGMTMAEAARKTGVAPSTLWRARSRAGLPPLLQRAKRTVPADVEAASNA